MSYGYCESCQQNIESQNGEYVCALTGCTTGINGKCKKYLPDMSNFEYIKHMNKDDMVRFFMLSHPCDTCGELVGKYCNSNDCVNCIKEWLDMKVSKYDMNTEK